MNRFEGKNILFVYYKFPPIKGIGTLRNVKFYRSLKKVARKVFVATTSNRHFMPSDDFQYDERDIIELPTFDFRTIYHHLTGGQGSLLESRDSSPQKWLPQWKEHFKKSFIARYFDEGGSYFVYYGMKLCSRIIEQEKIDVIISSYLPFDAHKLAYQLKSKYPQLYWIADYRDFFSDPMLRSSPGFSHRRDRHVKILSKADEVTTVSYGLSKRLLPFHANVHVIRNGINEMLVQNKSIPKFKLFTISYTGSIYPDAQDGDLLAKVLKELVEEGQIKKNHLQFINAGKDGLYWKHLLEKHGLGDILVNQGIISHEASLKLQKMSHLNILLSWASEDVSGILTGKLFEYLSAGTPIVAIVNGIYDPELHELIVHSGRGVLFYPSDLGHKQMKSYLINQYHTWRSNVSNPISIYGSDREKIPGIITWQDEFSAWAEDDFGIENHLGQVEEK